MTEDDPSTSDIIASLRDAIREEGIRTRRHFDTVMREIREARKVRLEAIARDARRVGIMNNESRNSDDVPEG
jgi:hypothetical protein